MLSGTEFHEIKWREILLLLQKVGKRQLEEMNRLPDSWQTHRLSAIDGNIGTATIMASAGKKAVKKKSFNLCYPGKQTVAPDAFSREKSVVPVRGGRSDRLCQAVLRAWRSLGLSFICITDTWGFKKLYYCYYYSDIVIATVIFLTHQQSLGSCSLFLM